MECRHFVWFELIGSIAEQAGKPAAEPTARGTLADPIRMGVAFESDFGVAGVLLLKALEPFEVSMDGQTAQVPCVKAVWQHDPSCWSASG